MNDTHTRAYSRKKVFQSSYMSNMKMDRWKTAAAISENASDRCVPQTQYESWLGPSALHVRIWCEVCLIFGSGRGSSSFSKKNMSNINTLLSQFSLLYRCILWT
uniref:Uncharacterized protein n=1 Tax=Triticum urartu TaxID=4572 RepID=A0A8R7ULU2_TRIUA